MNFLELALSSIESEVEFDVYRSFCWVRIVIAIEFEYFRTSSNIQHLEIDSCNHWVQIFPNEFEYLRSSSNFKIVLYWTFMNSGVSNCIEVSKFWEYLTDLRMNISDRVRIFFTKKFIELILNSYCIVSNYIDLSRTIPLSPLPSYGWLDTSY